MTDRNCVVCGGPIPPRKRKDAIYCSPKCAQKADLPRAREYQRKRLADPAQREKHRIAEAERRENKPGYREKGRKAVKDKYLRMTYGTDCPTDDQRASKDRYWRARKLGYRSGLEVKVARQLDAAGVEADYETHKVYFTPPLTLRSYTPDFVLPNGIVVETKGRFTTEDRQKAKFVKAEHPDLDVRFVFSNAATTLTKVSPTTYAAWCNRYGFEYATGSIPVEWIEEPPCGRRIKAIEAAGKKPA